MDEENNTNHYDSDAERVAKLMRAGPCYWNYRLLPQPHLVIRTKSTRKRSFSERIRRDFWLIHESSEIIKPSPYIQVDLREEPPTIVAHTDVIKKVLEARQRERHQELKDEILGGFDDPEDLD